VENISIGLKEDDTLTVENVTIGLKEDALTSRDRDRLHP
jgi:hypothetical protein